jgi:exonuclease SbcC
MITRVRLKNWKSHLESEFGFSKGVNVLTGIMGSGKTSIVEAISFALFGTFPALQSRKVALDELIMDRPARKDRAEIEVEFSVGGKDYLVKRIVERGKGTVKAEIREGGKLLDVSARNVTEIVQKLLQMDYELFSKAVYSEQNALDYFLKIPKGQRMQHIDRMLKLEQYEKVRERAVSLRNRMKERDREIVKLLSDMEKENLDGKINTIKSELKKLENKLKEMEIDFKRVKESRTALEKKLEAAEESHQKLTDVVKDMESLRAAIEEIDSGIKEKVNKLGDRDVNLLLEEFEKLKSKLGALKENVEEGRKVEKRLREEVASLNTKILMTEKKEIPELIGKIEEKEKFLGRIAEFKQKYPDIQAAVQKKKDRLNRHKKMLYQYQSRISELKSHLKNLDSDICPTCSGKITDNIRKEVKKQKLSEIGEFEKNIVSAEREINNMEKELEGMESERQDFLLLEQKAEGVDELKRELEKKREEMKDARKAISLKADELENLSGKLERMEGQLEDMTVEREKLSGLLDEAKTLERLEERRKKSGERLLILEGEKAGLEKRLRGIDIAVLRKNFRERAVREKEIQTTMEALLEKIKDRESSLSELEERQMMVENYRSRRRVNEIVMGQLKNFEDALKVTQQQLREEFVRTVNYIMNEIWPGLYPYGDFEDIRLAVDGDYTLQLRRNGAWLSADGIVSGGERSVACLALRIAFSVAFIPNLKWLILDEPTHNLDANAIDHFSKVLLESIGQFAEQVFIITHEDMSEALKNVYRLERNKEIGEPTRVEAV